MNKLLSFKKYIIISLVLSVLVLGFSFLFYNNNYIIFLKNYEQNIITYIDSKIKHFKKNNPNIDIKFKKIKMNVDGVNLKDIQINIKPDKKISIYSLNLDLDWWSLLALKVKFKLTIPKVYLKIKTNKIKFKTNKTNNVTPESFLAELNNEVYNIKKNKDLLSFLNLPISSLNILEANIDIINKKNNKYIAKINNSIITLNLNKRNKKIDFFSASVSFPGSLLKKEFFSLHLKSEIKNKHLLLRAKIGYKNLSALIKIKNKFTEFRIVTKLKSLSEILQKTSLQKGLDHLNGNLFLTIKKESDNAFSFTSKLSNFKSHGFKIGDLKSNGILKNSKLNVNYVNIESPIWAGQTKSFVINLNKKPYHISFDANVDKFKLHNLLGDKYISLFAKSLASCSGKFFPFLLNCSLTNTHVDNVKIYLKNKKEVLHAPALKGLSQVNISADSVNFKSSFSSITNSNKNKITVSANINYYDDSIINYKASLKDLSFITFFKKNLLGDAKISGSVKIKKNITINKNSFKSNNISLGKEFLGKLKFNSIYQDQQLAIKKIFFKNRDEQINGSLVFLFKKNSLFSNIKAQNINLSRIKPFLNIKQKHFFYGKIKKIFSKTLWNLDFQPLSSDTKLVISNLLIKKVYFPEINIYLKKNITNNFTLINLDSLNKTFNISGYIFNNLKLLLNLSAKKMALENFINFANPSSVTSLVDIKSKIKGTILNLNVKMNLKFYKTYINKIIQKNSAAVVKYSNNKISVVANFFNKTVSTNLVWNVKKMYLHNLFFKADNWDYSSLVYFYSKTNKHIKSKLTAKLSIVKKKNNKYSGALNIPSVSFKHPDINFKNKKPLLVTLKNNILFFKNFSLKGKSGYMNVYSNPNSNLDKLNIKINSKINLALFNNFLSESLITSGNLFLNNLKITGNLFKPLLNGNIKINKLAAKNTDKIIPSIQDSDINININNSKAILNKFIINLKNKAVLNAYGSILLKDSFNANIYGKISKLRLKTKDGLNILGSGDFKLYGKKNNYTLQSSYDILSGSFYKKILNWNKKNLDIDNKFLPKQNVKNNNSIFYPKLKLKLQTKSPIDANIVIGNIDINTKVFSSLKVNGSINRPLLNGKIYSNAGLIKIQKQRIFIDNINLEYKNTLLNKSNISLLAHSEINKIKIKIQARGQIDNIEFIFSSDPPLPENKIAFLLVFGILPKESDSDWRSASKKTSYSILSNLLKDYLKIKENLNVNLNLTTKENINTDGTSSGNIKLKNNKPVLNIEKNITKKLKLQATKELDSKSQNVFLLQYQINPNLSIKSSISEETDDNSVNSKKNIEFGLEYDIEFK